MFYYYKERQINYVFLFIYNRTYKTKMVYRWPFNVYHLYTSIVYSEYMEFNVCIGFVSLNIVLVLWFLLTTKQIWLHTYIYYIYNGPKGQ